MSSPTIDLIDLPVPDMPAHERVFSEAEAAIIADLVLWHGMPHLPARELLQLSKKRWSMRDPNNIHRIAQARRQDETRDWYFPISLSRWTLPQGQITPPERCFRWAGMWHPTADAVCPKLRPLPPMTCMLEDWQHASFPLCEIVASAGGLLLIQCREEVVPVRRSPRTKTALSWSPRGGLRSSIASVPSRSSRPARGNSSDIGARLLVCNPLTRECRELPEAKFENMGWKSWQLVYGYVDGLSIQIHMDVEDEANWYQVIVILPNFMAVYKSTTDSWNCMRFDAPWIYRGATARVAGHLYTADIQPVDRFGVDEEDALEHPIHAGTLRLFEVDTEAGRWMLVREYSLRWFDLVLPNPYRDFCRLGLSFFENVELRFLENVELVECMGSLYAIIPSWLQYALTIGEKQISRTDLDLPPWNESETRENRYKYVPMVLNVMKLEGDGEDTALLRMLNERPDSDMRTDHLDVFTSNWFTCKAVGSVIWVLYRQESLLSYDVVSREYTLRYIHKDRTHQSMNLWPECSYWSPFSYRPSFHMKP